jgi:hypothetical protein
MSWSQRSWHYWKKAYSRDITGNKKKIVIDNRYRWRAQKNSSPICPDLVSAAPNDDAQNKNAPLEVCSVVILGSGKRQWPRYFASVTGLEHSDDDIKLIACHCFGSITTDDLIFSFVTVYRYNADEVDKASVVWISSSTTDGIQLSCRIYQWRWKNQRTLWKNLPSHVQNIHKCNMLIFYRSYI